MRDTEIAGHVIRRLMIAGHCRRGCPGEVIVEHLSQRRVVCQSDIDKRLVETRNRTAIHFIVRAVTAVHLDDGGLVPVGLGVCAGAAECLRPVSGESLDMLRVETMTEGMANHRVGHDPLMPGTGKAAQAVVSTRRLKDSTHTSMVPTAQKPCNTTGGPIKPLAELAFDGGGMTAYATA